MLHFLETTNIHIHHIFAVSCIEGTMARLTLAIRCELSSATHIYHVPTNHRMPAKRLFFPCRELFEALKPCLRLAIKAKTFRTRMPCAFVI